MMPRSTGDAYLADVLIAGAAGALLSWAMNRSTAATWTVADIVNQFARTERQGWLPYFAEAATRYGFDQDLLMGIASRETNIRSILGDGGHGHGIMQIDR